MVKQTLTLKERVARKTVPGGGGCMLWTGGLAQQRHPILILNKKTMRVRRLVYQAGKGDITSNTKVWLTCKNNKCVTLDHMRAKANKARPSKYTQRRTPSSQDYDKWWKRVSLKALRTDGGCLLFHGAKRVGYGYTKFVGKSRYTHVISWERAHNQSQETIYSTDLQVRHKCQNRHCFAPAHLHEKRGDATIQSQDCREQGNMHGIDEKTARSIYDAKTSGKTSREIAEDHEVGMSRVTDIWQHKTHRFLHSDEDLKKHDAARAPRKERLQQGKVVRDNEHAKNIYDQKKTGKSRAEVAKAWNVSAKTVGRIWRHDMHRNIHTPEYLAKNPKPKLKKACVKKIGDSIIKEIYSKKGTGKSQATLAALYNVSIVTIYNIWNLRSPKYRRIIED